MSGRRLIIGDIHARYERLRGALEKASFSPEKDILYSVGDFCDRGDKPVQTLEYLMDLGDSFRPVLGNHDAWLESAPITGVADPNWTDNNGGAVTEKAIFSMPEDWRERLKQWLSGIPLIRVMEDDIIVHGGIPAGLGEDMVTRIAKIDRPVPLFRMLWNGETRDELILIDFMERFYWDRDYILSALRSVYGDNPMRRTRLREPFDTEKTIWIGHSQLVSGKPFHSEAYHLWAIDTGAGSGRGPITVMDMDTKEYWQA